MSRIERIAHLVNVDLIDLYGKIGVISNGAGMCLATNDMINAFGGTSSNFCELGGLTDEDQLMEILLLLNDNKSTKVIFLNFFGGMMDVKITADVIKKGMKLITKPIIVRLRGQNEAEAQKMLHELKNQYKELYVINDFTDAVEQAVVISKRS